MNYTLDENGNFIEEQQNEFAEGKQSNYPNAAPQTDASKPVVVQDTDFANSKANNYPGADGNNDVVDTNVSAQDAPSVDSAPTIDNPEQARRERILNENPSLRNMSPEWQNDFFASYRENGDDTYRGMLDASAKRKAELEADRTETQEERDRAKKRARLAGMINLVGGLANVATAMSSRDGRSVATPNTSAAHERDYEKEQSRLDKIKANLAAEDKNYVTLERAAKEAGDKSFYNAYSYANKNEIARQQAKDKHDLAAANLEKVKALTEKAKAGTATQGELAELRKKKLAVDIYNSNLAAATKKKNLDNLYKKDNIEIGYNNGTRTFIVPKEKWTTENIAQAWSKIPEDLRQEIAEAVMESVRMEGGSEEQAKKDGFNFFSGNIKWIEANKSRMESAIGVALEDAEGRGQAVNDYLNNLTKQDKQKKHVDTGTSSVTTGKDGKKHVNLS